MSSLTEPPPQPPRVVHLVRYEREKPRLSLPVGGAFLLMVVIVLLGFLSKESNILDLLHNSQTEAMPPPVHESVTQIDLSLVPPPPPEVNPDFVKPVEVIKQEAPPPIPKPPPKPVDPAPAKPTNTVFAASAFKAGDPNLPKPPYPLEAKQRHQQGRVVLSVTISGGQVVSVSVSQSSGFGVLDSTSRQWAAQRWKFPNDRSGTVSIPVDFHLLSP